MNLSLYIYRVRSYLHHILHARNTRGYGIHSPSLFNLVRYVLYDDNRYYCFAPIERERARLLRANKVIHVTDYGTGNSGNRRLKDIARTSLQPPEDAQLLFRLANHLQPQHIIELGTSLGITTAYLASVSTTTPLYTLEGSDTIAAEAQRVFQHLHLNNIHPVIGNIDDTLEPTLNQMGLVDFALIDANHQKEPTYRYFNLLATYCHPQSVLVFDDIHHSPDMELAWEMICEDERTTATIDTFNLGIVFFNPHLEKRTYIIKP